MREELDAELSALDILTDTEFSASDTLLDTDNNFVYKDKLSNKFEYLTDVPNPKSAHNLKRLKERKESFAKYQGLIE